MCRDLGIHFRTDRAELSRLVEQALHEHFGSNVKEYMHKSRSVIFNLNDPQNIDFIALLAVGLIKPSEVPNLSAEQMASIDKVFERARTRKFCMYEVQADWEAKSFMRVEGVFT